MHIGSRLFRLGILGLAMAAMRPALPIATRTLSFDERVLNMTLQS